MNVRQRVWDVGDDADELVELHVAVKAVSIAPEFPSRSGRVSIDDDLLSVTREQSIQRIAHDAESKTIAAFRHRRQREVAPRRLVRMIAVGEADALGDRCLYRAIGDLRDRHVDHVELRDVDGFGDLQQVCRVQTRDGMQMWRALDPMLHLVNGSGGPQPEELIRRFQIKDLRRAASSIAAFQRPPVGLAREPSGCCATCGCATVGHRTMCGRRSAWRSSDASLAVAAPVIGAVLPRRSHPRFPARRARCRPEPAPARRRETPRTTRRER